MVVNSDLIDEVNTDFMQYMKKE